MMRALHLDYASKTERHRLGILVLAAGITVAAIATLDYSNARDALTSQEIKTAEIRKAGKRNMLPTRGNSRESEATTQEYKAAQLALQRLSLRWTDLFTALESTRPNGVALIAIEPDPAKRVVKLTAEAKTSDDMLDYVEKLQSASGLADVVLASHQIRPSDPMRPMRFVVLASWVR
jgi:hypothetical protein